MKIISSGFADQFVRDKTCLYDLRVTLNGEQRYFIVNVHQARQTAFLKAIEKDAGFQLEDYGTILHRGWDEPEEELKQQLHERYGMYPEMSASTSD